MPLMPYGDPAPASYSKDRADLWREVNALWRLIQKRQRRDLSGPDPIWSHFGILSARGGGHRLYIEQPLGIAIMRASVNEPPTGQAIIVTLKVNGSTILAQCSIDPGKYWGRAEVSATTYLAADDYLQVDISQVGSTWPGRDLTVWAHS